MKLHKSGTKVELAPFTCGVAAGLLFLLAFAALVATLLGG